MQADLPPPQTLAEALDLLQVVCAELAALQAENARLQARVQALEARLGQNSTNSSRPPSSDPPATPPRPPAPPTGRQRGGQPGHPPHQRALVPLEQVDQLVAHWPTHSRGCQAPLTETAVGVRLAVEDRGPGVPADTAARLFDPFYQAATPTAPGQQGVGLGLAIVKEIVEGYGGRVGAENRRGGGARFWFELPGDRALGTANASDQ